MTMLYNGVAADQSGSGSPITATGPINVTYSAETAVGGIDPVLNIYARSDSSAQWALAHSTRDMGTFRVELTNGSQWYADLLNVSASGAYDVSYDNA